MDEANGGFTERTMQNLTLEIDSKGTIYKNGLQVVLVHVPDYEYPTWKMARRFLFELLAKGELPAKACLKACKEAGLTESSIRKAKMRTGIVSNWQGTVEASGHWWWKLPKAGHDKDTQRLLDEVRGNT